MREKRKGGGGDCGRWGSDVGSHTDVAGAGAVGGHVVGGAQRGPSTEENNTWADCSTPARKE
jgi:hypothetical protein